MRAVQHLASRPLVLERADHFDELLTGLRLQRKRHNPAFLVTCAAAAEFCHGRGPLATTCCLLFQRPLRGVVLTRTEACDAYLRLYTVCDPLPDALERARHGTGFLGGRVLAAAAAAAVAAARRRGGNYDSDDDGANDDADDDGGADVDNDGVNDGADDSDDDDDAPAEPDRIRATRALLATYLFCAHEVHMSGGGDALCEDQVRVLFEQSWSMPRTPSAYWPYEPQYAAVRAGVLLRGMLADGGNARRNVRACIVSEEGDISRAGAMLQAADLAFSLVPRLLVHSSRRCRRLPLFAFVPLVRADAAAAAELLFEPPVTRADVHAAMRVVPGPYALHADADGSLRLQLSCDEQLRMLTRTLPALQCPHRVASLLSASLGSAECNALLWAAARLLGYFTLPLHAFRFYDAPRALLRLNRTVRLCAADPGVLAHALGVAFSPRCVSCWMTGGDGGGGAFVDYVSDDDEEQSYTTDRQELLDREVRRREAEDRRLERRIAEHERREANQHAYGGGGGGGGGGVTMIGGTDDGRHLARMDDLLDAGNVQQLARLRCSIKRRARIHAPDLSLLAAGRRCTTLSELLLLCEDAQQQQQQQQQQHVVALYAPQFSSGSAPSIHAPTTTVPRAYYMQRYVARWWDTPSEAVPRLFCDALPGMLENVLYGGAPWPTL